ncbi:MAG: hypothetical protein ABSD59_07530 [Terracidiphilus sp.]|jgi:hypothetical protein
MLVSFSQIQVGDSYSRHQLAALWGCSSFHAIARGIVTPKDDNKIIFFITEEKQESAEQYEDSLRGGKLRCEGPTDHFGESRILSAKSSGDQIHLFYRNRHHSDFEYVGKLAREATRSL